MNISFLKWNYYICSQNKHTKLRILHIVGTLRFILALSVVIAHSTDILGFRLVGGQLAVQVFYMISGFYMALVLKEKYIGSNNYYKLFISNRFLRLYPIYWFILIGTVLVSIAAYLYSGSGFIAVYAKYFDSMSLGSFLFLILTNIIIFFQDVVLFLGLDTTTGNLFFTSNFWATDPVLADFMFIPQAWTIGIELTFYLIAPFIVNKKTKYILIGIACLFLLRLFLAFGLDLRDDPWSHRFFPTELTFFLLGIIAYHLYKKYATLNISPIYLKTIWISIVFITLIFSFIPLEHSVKSIFYLILFYVSIPFIFILTKNWKFDRNIGELSYPIYISHTFVLICIRPLGLPYLYGHNFGIHLVICSIIFSILLNEFVAKKIETVRQKRVKTKKILSPQ